MKAKTIKAILRKKTDEWLETISNTKVRQMAKDNTIITGGSIASMLIDEKVNDFDIYFRTREAAKAVADYYVKKFIELKAESGYPRSLTISIVDPWTTDIHNENRFGIKVKSAGIASEEDTEESYQYFEQDSDPDALAALDYVKNVSNILQEDEDPEKEKYRPIFLSTNAITLSNKIQLVIRFWGNPEDIHKNFDYVHATNYWTSWDNQLVLNKEALQALLSKELRYVGSRYPICSLIRLRKFLVKGWTVNAGQILKMSMQISELDLKDLDVLEDQLTGVDVAYFMEVITKLREKDPDKVNAAYLIEIIDRMF